MWSRTCSVAALMLVLGVGGSLPSQSVRAKMDGAATRAMGLAASLPIQRSGNVLLRLGPHAGKRASLQCAQDLSAPPLGDRFATEQ